MACWDVRRIEIARTCFKCRQWLVKITYWDKNSLVIPHAQRLHLTLLDFFACVGAAIQFGNYNARVCFSKDEFDMSQKQEVRIWTWINHFSRNNTCFLLDWEKKTNEPRGQWRELVWWPMRAMIKDNTAAVFAAMCYMALSGTCLSVTTTAVPLIATWDQFVNTHRLPH